MAAGGLVWLEDSTGYVPSPAEEQGGNRDRSECRPGAGDHQGAAAGTAAAVAADY